MYSNFFDNSVPISETKSVIENRAVQFSFISLPENVCSVLLGMLAAFAVLALYTFGRAVYDIGRNDGSRMETGHAGRVELPTPAETDNHLTPYLYGTEEE